MPADLLRLARVLLWLSLLVPGPLHAGTLSILSWDEWVRVGYVIDGDTFVTDAHDKVRLLGINAPEIMHNDNPGEPLGETSRRQLRKLIEGKRVRLSFDRQRRDDYGRKLAHVYVDGLWVNGKMVELGLAHVYTFAPNFKQTSALLDLERKARSKRLGIWNTARFRLLQADRIQRTHIGQFRLIEGRIDETGGWNFHMGKLHVSIPKKSRIWFAKPLNLRLGQKVIVRGKIRISSRGKFYLALYSPYDLEVQ
ncbi:MAG: nuclease [Zetaproteobacteria bacterium]|nr:MAG: nuclease [Zetaproteobacteria bacterium]